MAKVKPTRYTLFYIAFALFFLSAILTVSSGTDVKIAIIWNLLAALDINYNLIPASHAANPLVLTANLLDAFVFALLAVDLASFFFSLIRRINLGERFTMSKIKKIKNHVILVPYNSFSRALANELRDAKIASVTIVEDEDEVRKLYKERELAIVGDSKSVEMYNLARIEKSIYVIACSEDDTQNALITVTARTASKKARVVSRVTDIENLSKLGRAGAQRMIMPEVTAGTDIGEVLVNRLLSQN